MLLLTTLAVTSSVSASAETVKFKMAVIKDSIGKVQPAVVSFNNNMESCTSHATRQNFGASEQACTAAIKTIESMDKSDKKVSYLKSLSYSNRGISRFLNDDISGAVDDFTTAILIDSNAITKTNLSLVKHLSPAKSAVSFTSYSD